MTAVPRRAVSPRATSRSSRFRRSTRRCELRSRRSRRPGATRSRTPRRRASVAASSQPRSIAEGARTSSPGRTNGDRRMTRVRSVELRIVRLPLVRPFRTSFGETRDKECILARVETDDAEGWGECVAGAEPDYSEEWNAGAWLVLRDLLAPALISAGDVGPDDVEGVLAFVRGNSMAKATLIDAFLDAHLRALGRSLAEHLGGTRDRVECGVSVGIQPSTEALLELVAGYLGEGYRRIKLKNETGPGGGGGRAGRPAPPHLPPS